MDLQTGIRSRRNHASAFREEQQRQVRLQYLVAQLDGKSAGRVAGGKNYLPVFVDWASRTIVRQCS